MSNSPVSEWPRGSEWRKWDLHVHSPFSALNNGFGNDFDAYAKELLTLAVEKEIAAIGITDYFCIDGYVKLRELLASSERLSSLVGTEVAAAAQGILVLPNIELRTNIIVVDSDGKDHRVGLHVLFSDGLDPSEIQERFLRELKVTVSGGPGTDDEEWSLTIPNLEALGKRLKSEHAEFEKYSDLFVGMMNAVVDHKLVTKALESQSSIFRERYLICVPADEDLSKCNWDGQGHLVRKVLLKKSHFLFSANPGTREFGLGRRHKTPEQFCAEFGSLKPCIHGSDAHEPAKLFEPDEARYTWIRADPTFLGLRQVLAEPENRVLICEQPEFVSRLPERASFVVDSVRIQAVEGYSGAELWFDDEVPLNSGLVAIIGNKGSGKSALAETIGLLGNTPRFGSFSFLCNSKFRDLKNDKAKSFQAELSWIDGSSDGPVNLDDNPLSHTVEKVKYIPQNYLEEICNEIGRGRESRFLSELEQVIFTHVPESEKLGYESLAELLGYKTEETRRAIDLLVSELKESNREIVALEKKLDPNYRSTLQSQLEEKQREIEALRAAPPKEKPKPEESADTKERSEEIATELDSRRESLREAEERVKALKQSESELIAKKSAGEKLRDKVRNLETQIAKAIADMEDEAAKMGLELQDIVSFEVRPGRIDSALQKMTDELDGVVKELQPGDVGTVAHLVQELRAQIKALEDELGKPQREYQAYIREHAEWKSKCDELVGSADKPGTLTHIKARIAAIAEIPLQLRKHDRARNRLALEIYREKRRLCRTYQAYYSPVQDNLKEYSFDAEEAFKLSFQVSVTESGFADGFLGLVDRRPTGPWRGIEDSSAQLSALLQSTDFDSVLATARFTRKLIRLMRKDAESRVGVASQLRKGTTLTDLYDYVFSLGYLEPEYSLKWDGKRVEQLSPGERGDLLLIFYLLIDQGKVPLVVDQPEENLDNQTVYRTLVPCVKRAKTRRQIVLVTHNPNLAVVCDAEQVICADIDKEHGNKVTYVSGAIENPAINKAIIDILEGTRPAFDKRDEKYLPEDSL